MCLLCQFLFSLSKAKICLRKYFDGFPPLFKFKKVLTTFRNKSNVQISRKQLVLAGGLSKHFHRENVQPANRQPVITVNTDSRISKRFLEFSTFFGNVEAFAAELPGNSRLKHLPESASPESFRNAVDFGN